MSLADIALIVGVGRLYGVPFPSHWPAIALTLVLGAASFCALGVAVASVISNAEAAPAVAQLVLFPLLFLSGTYMPIHSALLNRVSGLASGPAVQRGADRAAIPAHRRRLAGAGHPGGLGRDRRPRGGPALPLGPEAGVNRGGGPGPWPAAAAVGRAQATAPLLDRWAGQGF